MPAGIICIGTIGVEPASIGFSGELSGVACEVSGLAIGVSVAGVIVEGEPVESEALGLRGALIDWAIVGMAYPAIAVATPRMAICFSLLTFISEFTKG